MDTLVKTKTIRLGGPTGIIESEKELAEAISYEQEYSNEFNRVEQPTYIVHDIDAEDKETWEVYTGGNDSNADDTARICICETEAAADKISAALNEKIDAQIAETFPQVTVPADLDIDIGIIKTGNFPQSRYIDVTIGEKEHRVSWSAMGSSDHNINYQKIAELIKKEVADLLK